MTNTDPKPAKTATPWIELLSLIRLCPGQFLDPRDPNRIIKVSGNTRLLLQTIALHVSGESNETFVSRGRLLFETKMTRNTLDGAISGLKLAGLLKSRSVFNTQTLKYRTFYIIQRKFLADCVGNVLNEKQIKLAISVCVQGDQSDVEVPAAWAYDSIAQIKLLAKADGIELHIGRSKPFSVDNKEFVTLSLRPKDGEKQDVDLLQDAEQWDYDDDERAPDGTDAE